MILGRIDWLLERIGFLRLYRDLESSRSRRIRHIQEFTKLKRGTADRENAAMLEYIYECLSILDSKVAVALTANSLVMAVFAILLIQQNGASSQITFSWIVIEGQPLTIVPLLKFGFLLNVISSLFALLVVRVRWMQLKKIIPDEVELEGLLHVREKRTAYYRFSLELSCLSLLVLAVYGVKALFIGN